MQKKRWVRIICLIMMMTFLLTGCQQLQDFLSSQDHTSEVSENANFQIHVIDVGQGDSILIQCGGENLLIDAGENNMGERVVGYLQSQNIKKLDYIIGTHPHSDHIGGLDIVIKNLSIGKVILPAVEHSTKTFEDVLDAIDEKGLKITKPRVGTEYTLGDASFVIIAPNSEEYEDLNDYSVGIRVKFGDTSYLFAGDADVISEDEMCHNGLDLHSDVLKLNHHGSAYSNNQEFIDAVSPSYAVISVGEGNSYGHPHTEVLEDMKQRGIDCYRTDQLGTIVITSDGSEIYFNTVISEDVDRSNNEQDAVDEDVVEKVVAEEEVFGEEVANDAMSQEYVYITATGSKYHHIDCSYLAENSMEKTLEEVTAQGYEPCSRCFE